MAAATAARAFCTSAAPSIPLARASLIQRSTTVLEAAQQSGIADRFEDVDLDNAKFGIFGKVVAPQQALREGDRVEIYRPLIADPKEVRKARAARAKERRKEEKEA